MRKVALILSMLAVIALAVLDFTYDGGLKPDAVYPMVNQHIEW